MEIVFQLLDCDYVMLDGSPIVRIFGKTENGKSVCTFVKNYFPYFYVRVADDKEVELKNFLEKKFKSQVLRVEEVEKYLPFGFQENKTKLLKIVSRDPSQVPMIRDGMSNQKFVERIFEADILFKYRFMADWNLFGMRWYKVYGAKTKTQTVKVDYPIELESIEETQDRESNFKFLSVDIETISTEGLPDATKDQIAIISLAFNPEFNGHSSLVLVAKPAPHHNGDIQIFKNEKEMLQEFSKIISNYDPDAIVGYNVNNFDIPFISERFSQDRLPKTIGRDNHKPLMSNKIAGNFRNSLIGRVIVDVYDLVKETQVKTQLAEKGFLKLKRYGLDDVAKELLGEGKVKIVRSDIPKMWNGNGEQMKLLLDYARRDAELTLKLLLRISMLDKFVEISKVSGLLLQDTLDGGEATRVENILLRRFNQEDFVLPLRPSSNEILKRSEDRISRGFKGALVLEPTAGLHTTPVIYLDFKSMYPSIFIAYNLCPSTLILKPTEVTDIIETPNKVKLVGKKIREGIMPRVIKELIQERDKVRAEAKRTKDEAKKKILEAKQIALKYMTNSFYGYTGYERARLYMLDIATAITACGRFFIEKTKSIVEEDRTLSVVYGDTDSIMVKTNAENLDQAFEIGIKLEKKVNEALEGIIEIKIESVFGSLLILSKKRYAGLSYEKSDGVWKEKLMMKGIETVRRDWCDLTSETLQVVLEIILREKNPKKALNYMRDVIRKLERSEVPVEKLVVTKSITKSIHVYKGIQPHVELLKKLKKRDEASAPGIGDRIGFVIIHGTQLLSERSEDPEYVKAHNLKIDSKYYIESQILPPLERVFEAIGVSRSELLHAGKQLGLLEAIKNGAKKSESQVLHDIDGFVCNKCSKTYKMVPMIGKCFDCGGEISFYKGETKARYFAP